LYRDFFVCHQNLKTKIFYTRKEILPYRPSAVRRNLSKFFFRRKTSLQSSSVSEDSSASEDLAALREFNICFSRLFFSCRTAWQSSSSKEDEDCSEPEDSSVLENSSVLEDSSILVCMGLLNSNKVFRWLNNFCPELSLAGTGILLLGQLRGKEYVLGRMSGKDFSLAEQLSGNNTNRMEAYFIFFL
jgi:hypothetical protein